MNSKGQSALEYLMTYGWALVVMVIVIAALVALDVFNLGAVTDTCAGFPTTIAYQRHVYSGSGTFQLAFLNGTGERIRVTMLNVDGTDKNAGDINADAGESVSMNKTGFTGGSVGNAYKVPVTITYNILGDINFSGVKAQGTCLGKYQ
ncbi:hypothetical protein HZB89_02020 [archaeon]|nr:hypothetical protein [archaeon]